MVVARTLVEVLPRIGAVEMPDGQGLHELQRQHAGVEREPAARLCVDARVVRQAPAGRAVPEFDGLVAPAVVRQRKGVGLETNLVAAEVTPQRAIAPAHRAVARCNGAW